MACFITCCKSHSSSKQTGSEHISFHIRRGVEVEDVGGGLYPEGGPYPIVIPWTNNTRGLSIAILNSVPQNPVLNLDGARNRASMPKDTDIQEQWYTVIPRARTHWTKHSRICSKHFTPDCYQNYHDKWRKLKPDAVPTLFMGVVFIGGKRKYNKKKSRRKTSTDDEIEMSQEVFKVCRVCLETDAKFYSLNQYNLETIYTEVTGLVIRPGDKLPSTVCAECAVRLARAHRVRGRAHAASALLAAVIQRDRFLSDTAIQSIDRSAHKLTSPLEFKTLGVNKYDIETYEKIIDEIQIEMPKLDEEKIEQNHLDIDIKIETENTQALEDIINFVDHNNFEPKPEGKIDIIENCFTTTNFDEAIDFEKDENVEKDGTYDLSDNSVSNFDPTEILNEKKKVKKEKKKIKKSYPKAKTSKSTKGQHGRNSTEKDIVLKDTFIIEDLSYEEQVQEMRKRAENEKYRNADYKCELCYKGYMDHESFKCHLERHNEKSGEFQCELCKVRFRKLYEVRGHLVKVHLKRYNCTKCPLVTVSREVARRHKEYHDGVTHSCRHCGLVFKKVTSLNSHIRIKHPSDTVCALCGFSFINARGLTLHQTVRHQPQEQVPPDGPRCEECDIRFKSDKALHKHYRISPRHTTNNKPQDRNDGRPIKRKKWERLHDHLEESKKRKLPTEGPVACEECGAELASLQGYYVHFRRMHPDSTKMPPASTNFMCELCGKFFNKAWQLNDHKNVHASTRQFKCDKCDKTFFTKSNMKIHIAKMHSGRARAHACKLCGKVYTSKSNLLRHMVSHTGVKSHKCEFCNKAFALAETKKLHITYVHLKKPWPKRNRDKRMKKQGLLPPPSPPPLPVGLQPWPSCSGPAE